MPCGKLCGRGNGLIFSRVNIVFEVTCDGCGKTVAESEPDGWVHFATGHHDWDNDSIESTEWWDACSFSCFRRGREMWSVPCSW